MIDDEDRLDAMVAQPLVVGEQFRQRAIGEGDVVDAGDAAGLLGEIGDVEDGD